MEALEKRHTHTQHTLELPHNFRGKPNNSELSLTKICNDCYNQKVGNNKHIPASLMLAQKGRCYHGNELNDSELSNAYPNSVLLASQLNP